MLARYRCPTCGRDAEICVAALIEFLHRLDLPYFVCVGCGNIGYDRAHVRTLVTDLRKKDIFAKKVPWRDIYRKAVGFLDGIIAHRVAYFGDRHVRFRKVPTETEDS